MKIEMVYGLRYYVTNTYPKFSNKRGGQSFTPIKKDKKGFKIRVQYAINNTEKVLNLIAEKYPLSFS